jgi:transposase
LNHDTTLLLDLEGVAVERVERRADGSRLIHLVTEDETARACPACGVLASAPKGWVCTRPRDLPYGHNGLGLVWRKRRWYCREEACARASFTESVPQIPARARLTTRLRATAGNRVRDDAATVAQAGREFGLSWPTVMAATRLQAADLVEADPEPVAVLGIDETRRGRPRWVKDETTGTWRLVADRWHVGFVDLSGGQGLLGQVEGRSADDVAYWLAGARPAWRGQVRYVAIDMCTVFVSAVRRILPHAVLVVDHFHLVQLANHTVTEVRRRTTWSSRGRRGRKGDPEWDLRRLLMRNLEDLSPAQQTKLFTTLGDLGGPGATILTAYIAKEELRHLLALARTDPPRTVIAHRLTRFHTWCANSGIGELERLARTIDTWWPQIEAFLHTGITNAGSEATNRVVKLAARCAYGFRNPTNQRLRTRCVTTRRARGCLNPAQDR